MIYQDPLDFPSLSVLDNYMLGTTGDAGRLFYNEKQYRKRLEELCSVFNFTLAPGPPCFL